MNKEHLGKLIEIAEQLELHDYSEKLNSLKERLESEETELILPLIGEFSSGKTSLINALTDSKSLETASKPTTATLFEIHFGSERQSAKVIEGNREYEVSDIANLKNEDLEDAAIVHIYDTSHKVPQSVVLVDTPGLSSNTPKHRLTLDSVLPLSDAILLVSDINQQITKSLLDFIEESKLTKKQIFLILTKCDTKTQKEISEVKNYIIQNINLPVEHIVSVSAHNDNVEELTNLFSYLKNNKREIIDNVVENRINEISINMLESINLLLNSITSDKTLAEEIEEHRSKLKHLNNKIEVFIKNASFSIEELINNTTKDFHNNILERLDIIVRGKSNDYNSEVYNTTNRIAGNSFINFSQQLPKVLFDLAKKKQGSIEEVSLDFLQELDTSNLEMSALNMDLNLNNLGHEYDSMLANVTKGALAVGAAAAVITTAGALAPVAATAAGSTTAASATTVLAGEVGEVAIAGAVVKASKRATRVQRVTEVAVEAQKISGNIEEYDNKLGGNKNGAIMTLVSKITDSQLGKPQRRRAIDNYISSSILPDFTYQINVIKSGLISTIEAGMKDSAESKLSELTTILEDLKVKQSEHNEQYKSKIKELKEFRNTITQNI